MKHKWTYQDNQRVFAGYLTKESAKSISKETGIPEKSIKMKLDNFKYLMTGKGLSNCSSDSIKVVDVYNSNKAKYDPYQFDETEIAGDNWPRYDMDTLKKAVDDLRGNLNSTVDLIKGVFIVIGITTVVNLIILILNYI